jgi:AraC-like DNA-binding protein
MKTKDLSGVDFSFREDMAIDDLSFGKCDYKYELIYVTSGEGRWVIEGGEIPLESGSFYIFKPLTYYAVDTAGSEEFRRYSISFAKEDIHQQLWDYLDSLFVNGKEESPYARINCFAKEDIERVLEGVSYAEKLPEEQKQQYLSTIVTQLLIILSSAESEFASLDSDDLAVRMMDYINYNVAKGNIVTLDNLARYFFVSKFYLCRVFKKHNGISVHGYINQKRVMYAKQLIESGETASGAAYRVGFGDYSAFYRAYVKIVGRSPKAHKGEK